MSPEYTVGIPETDFNRVWSLAVSGELKYVRVAFTEPYRNSALVVSAQFSNRSEDYEPEFTDSKNDAE